MPILHLALKGVYFDQIQRGEKLEEYRLCTPYWQKRLEGRSYGGITLTKGYPAKDDTSRRITREWRGYRKATITHPHFGSDPVEVYAIRVN